MRPLYVTSIIALSLVTLYGCEQAAPIDIGLPLDSSDAGGADGGDTPLGSKDSGAGDSGPTDSGPVETDAGNDAGGDLDAGDAGLGDDAGTDAGPAGCATNPCENGGTCADDANGFTCTCAPGFTGTKCETNIDECGPNPCQNGGTCADGINTFTCTCAPGYSGTHCEISAFGSGADGALIVTTPTTINTIASGVVGSAGGGTVTLDDPTSFAIGQVLILHQSRGTGAGTWQRATITALADDVATIAPALSADFVTNAGNERAQAVVVPQYTNITISANGQLTAPAWNGSTGGILAFDSTGTLTVDVADGITMTGKGFAGGSTDKFDPQAFVYKMQGESPIGPGATHLAENLANGGGGGGGAKKYGCSGSGGGGGGYGTVGANGGMNTTCNGFAGAVGGGTYGDTPGQLFFGAGGGSGGYATDQAAALGQGRGGNGGGIVLIRGNVVSLGTAAISSGGGAGAKEFGTYGGGGGGAGGAVYLAHAGALTGIANVIVTGGAGGGTNANGAPQVGGAGGEGRIIAIP